MKILKVSGLFFLITSTLACNLMQTTVAPSPTVELLPTSTIVKQSTINGTIWHELCEFTGGQGGDPLVLGRGCVQWGSAAAEFGPNQIRDNFEEGWEGVTMRLGAGACPSTGLATVVSDSTGSFIFSGLLPGIYCVSYSNLEDGNDTILIPGEPTFPSRGEEGFFTTIDMSAGGDKTVLFGYAWQTFN